VSTTIQRIADRRDWCCPAKEAAYTNSTLAAVFTGITSNPSAVESTGAHRCTGPGRQLACT
jgi:hypothetical protein